MSKELLFELPPWRSYSEFKGLPLQPYPPVALWSGAGDPPKLGQRVGLLLNGWEGCQGTVMGYRVDDGGDINGRWLSVWVRVLNRPEWHRKENPDRDVCLFVGLEVEAL